MTGYLYILKHGIGPGTMPKDVTILKEKDLPNYYTAVWLDRFLTTSELKQYDIPSETRINELLSRIDYCQTDNGDDVVPCDEVLASSYIKSAREPKWWGSTYSCQVVDAYNKGELTYKNMEEWETEYNGGFKPSNMGTKGILDYYIKTGKDPRDEVEACDTINASTRITASDCFTDEFGETYTYDEIIDYWNKNKDSDPILAQYNSFYDWFEESMRNGYFKPCDEVEACDDIKASSYAIPDKKLVFKDGDSYEFHYTSGEGDVFEPKSGSGNWWTSYIVTPDNRLLSWEFSGRYTPVDAVYGKDFWVEDNSVDACGDVNCSTDTKYFANMVNGSSDPELNDDFLVEGYYDEQLRGLAESYETSDISALNETINDYANKGYFIRVRNLTDGVIYDFSADNWFDDLASDGGAELFMSW